MLSYRHRKLLTSSLRRAVRWEFWPMSIFYLPIVGYLVWLTLRHRGFLPLSCNPGLPMSGLVGEKKANTLGQLQDAGSSNVALFRLLAIDDSVEERAKQVTAFMQAHDLSYPIVMKPDFGQRGQQVSVVRTADDMFSYLRSASGDVLVQQHIEGEEFGLFYMRLPNETKGTVFSITEKTFPVLVGDGISSLEKLILEQDRTHYMARYLLALHQERLDLVLAEGASFKVVEIGSHCRGSVFLDGNQHRTDALIAKVDEISADIEGFYFGRYDIRVPSVDDLQAGDNIKVLEVNGLTSESTNIYDPSYSVFDAYRILFKQWRLAFAIGQQNIAAKRADKVSLAAMLRYLRVIYT